MAGTITLSARMQAVADMVSRGNRVCDVGCDHGYISIYLVQKGTVPAALAMDINEGPLERAREHVKQAGLSDYITLRLSDGLSSYEIGEADTLVCAGMGGRLMQRILLREPEKTRDFKELICQPQSEIAAFRKFLRNQGYSVKWEDMILEENKFYPIIKAVPGREAGGWENESLSDRYGPVLLKNRHPVLIQYLRRERENGLELKKTLEAAGNSRRAFERLAELYEELGFLQEAMKICGCEIKREEPDDNDYH